MINSIVQPLAVRCIAWLGVWVICGGWFGDTSDKLVHFRPSFLELGFSQFFGGKELNQFKFLDEGVVESGVVAGTLLPLRDGDSECKVAKVLSIVNGSLSPAVEQLHKASDSSAEKTGEDADAPDQVEYTRAEMVHLYFWGIKVALICGIGSGLLVGIPLLLLGRWERGQW